MIIGLTTGPAPGWDDDGGGKFMCIGIKEDEAVEANNFGEIGDGDTKFSYAKSFVFMLFASILLMFMFISSFILLLLLNDML